MKLRYLTKYIYYLIITLAIISLGMTAMFLYDNFYRTLIQAQVVYILRNQVALEVVDSALWDKVLKNFRYKKTSQIQENTKIPDPFSPLTKAEKE